MSPSRVKNRGGEGVAGDCFQASGERSAGVARAAAPPGDGLPDADGPFQ